MASEIRVNKINSQTGVGTITLSPTGVDISGITTAATLKVGTGVTASSDGDIFATGVCTATTFSGSGASLTNIPDSALSAVTASKLTGALPAISGANLTGISGVSVANQGDNRLITATGTTDSLNGESTATYNGTKLSLTGGSGDDGIINMLELKHLNTSTSTGGGTGDGPGLLLNGYYSSNEWALAKIAAVNAGGSYGSGYGGALQFWVHPANGTQTASVIKGAEIIGDGSGANLTITDGNLIMGTSGHGINFSATSDASGMSDETLDDYEEGSWTPQIRKYVSGSFGTAAGMADNGTVQRSTYTKIGNVVSLFLHWDGFQVSDANYAALGGLPYSTANSGGGGGTVGYTDAFTSNQNQGILVGSAGDLIYFYINSNAWNGWSTSSNRTLYIQATYLTT